MMVKDVDLLSYWMPVLRQLKEFKEIAKAEEPEVKALLEACDSALSNFFIPTANEAPDVVPTWIPDGYELSNIDIFETPIQKKFVALYINGEKQLRIAIQSYLETYPEQVEQSEGFVEIYESESVDYYLFANKDVTKAVWINGNYECYISGELTIEELKMMIDSIGKGRS